MREVAIVGISCRLPGGLEDVGLLWEALLNKVNTASDVPLHRWSSDWHYSSDESSPGKAYVKRANFLNQDIRDFDASFFDLPPSVAENLDPQQRIMLEVVWEAFENAGIPLPELAGSNVGVYVGGFMLDHMVNMMNPDNAPLINQNTAAGMMMTMLSNRISHAFDLRGPSLSIDTACSSSLTAFNYGVKDVQVGACDVAVVGGVNVMTRPEYPVGMSKGQFLARDGECKSFDERGDGYGRSEGAGVVVLKELSKAIADGDRILATVLASGVNSDGRTPGISMPSADAQETLARRVCTDNNIDPKSVHYVECHGTGTSVGDPIEAGSIGRVFGGGRQGDDRVVIGTIKSNIGHTEAVAGVAGVIKAVLSLNNRMATPLANLKTPNSKIPFDELGIRLADDAIPLGKSGDTLRAAVNSFGYGGTNAFTVLENGPTEEKVVGEAGGTSEMPMLLPLSTRSNSALKEMASQIADVLESGKAELNDVLHTTARKRSHLTHRAVLMGESTSDLVAALKKLSNDETDVAIVKNDVPFGGLEEAVFVYTGMGPQWWGMGHELYRDDELFRKDLDEADAIFTKIAGFSILEEMLKDEASSRITKTEYAQPANFMIQYGVTKFLERAGVTAGAIVGHSVGEVGSAYAAGVLTLEEALKVSYHRSRTQAKTAGMGSMLAVGLGSAQMAPYLERLSGRVDIAAINGPSSMTVSGDTVSIHSLAEELTRAEVFNRILNVEVPYHSYVMDSISDELISSLADINPQVPQRKLYSTVTGQQVDDVAYDGSYWASNVRQPVLFMDAVKNLMEKGYSTFIEVGPQPVLTSALKDCARTFGKDVRLVETLRQGTEKKPALPELQAMQRAVAGAYVAGAIIDWNAVTPVGNMVRLPNYPWQRERHWLETDQGKSERLRDSRNPLLGYARTSAANVYRNVLTHESVSYLCDHVVTGTSVMPAAGYIEMMLQLGHEIYDDVSGIDVRNISIAGPMLLNRSRSAEVFTHYDATTSEVLISSAESGSVNQNSLHVSAEIGRIDNYLVDVQNIDLLKARFGEASSVPGLYSTLSGLGLQYGPAFQGLETVYLNPERGDALASIQLDKELCKSEGYILHPSLLDGCFQMLMGVLRDGSTMYLPTGFTSIRVMSSQTPEKIWCYGRLVSQSAKNIITDLTLFDEAGRTVAEVRGMQATASSGRKGQRVDKWGDPVALEEMLINWQVGDELDEPSRIGRWLVVGEKGEAHAEEVVAELENMGAMAPVLVTLGSEFEFGEDEAVIRAGNDEDCARLFREIGDVHGLAFMHGLSAGNESDPTGEIAIETMLSFSKALTDLPADERPRVYYITQSAYVADATQTDVNPSQAAIGGFMRVAHNEIEATKATLIDMPARVDTEVVEAVVAELLADAVHDEVALRAGRRMVSYIAPSDVANTPFIEDTQITEYSQFYVRPSSGDDAEGMVTLAQQTLAECGSDEIRVRVADMSLPSSLLADPSKDTLDQAHVAFVGEIEAVGSSSMDVAKGQRVFGYAPAEIASHIQAARADFLIAPLDSNVESGDALELLNSQVIAKYAATSANLDAGDCALVMVNDPIAVAIAAELESRDVTVIRVDAAPAELYGAVESALVSNADNRFDAIVAPLSVWIGAVGTECLATGGTLIDSDTTAHMVRIPGSVSGIIRCDLSVVAGRPRRLKAAMESAAKMLVDGGGIENAGLSIGLGDIVEQKLDIPPIDDLRIDIEFNLVGSQASIHVKRPLTFSSDSTYLVTGGLGGFGMQTASWLVEHGARTLVLASRSGANSDEKKAFVEQLSAAGVTVEIPKYDLSDLVAVKEMIEWIEKDLPPLKGIFHSAAVIEDYDIKDLEPEVFRRVMRSKATSGWALHEASKHIDLDQFVCYSSVASIVGNRRQSAYSAANCYLGGLVRHRRHLGMSGLTVMWGAIGDVGVVAENNETEEFLKYIGIRGLNSDEALGRLEAFITRDVTEISCTLMASWGDWARYETIGAQSPRFETVLIDAEGGDNDEARDQLISELINLDLGERNSVLTMLIAAVIAGELRQEPESLSIDRPINDLGVDSLMATELQVLLGSTLGVSVSVMDLLGGATIRAISDQTLAGFGLDKSNIAVAE